MVARTFRIDFETMPEDIVSYYMHAHSKSIVSNWSGVVFAQLIFLAICLAGSKLSLVSPKFWGPLLVLEIGYLIGNPSQQSPQALLSSDGAGRPVRWARTDW